MVRCFFLVVLICRTTQMCCQEDMPKADLLRLLKVHQHDTTRIDVLNELTWPVYSYDLPDSSLYYGKQAILLSQKIKDEKRMSVAHRRIGITYSNMGDLNNAIHHQEESYALSKKLKYERGMYLALNNIGVAYLNNELINKALTYFLKSLKHIEGTTDYTNTSLVYSNCGMIYRRSGDTKKALEFFHKALRMAELSKVNDLLVSSYCNLSGSTRLLGFLDSSNYYLAKAAPLINEKTQLQTKFNYFLSRALLQMVENKNEQALATLFETKPYVTGLSDEITLLINIAEQYVQLKNTKKALDHYAQAYDLSYANKLFDNLEYICNKIAEIHENEGNMAGYRKYIKWHIAFKDSNTRLNKINELRVQQLEFDYERRQVADSVRFEAKERITNMELELAESDLRREKMFRILLFCIILIILFLAGFTYNRLQLTKKQNKIIERQKQIVEFKNREIMDSINYAKRLQEAILPQLVDVRKAADIDILYMPKDIIGGDFYFFEKFKDHVFIAICDCTGHGIPGAMMSVVCHHALSKSIKEFNLTDPALILAKTRKLVVESLNAAHQNIKDGMDCSLLVINSKKGDILWAGANNSLWLVTNNVLHEIKADKQPVAFYENATAYTCHKVEAEKGTRLYLSTDGYADQFGGPRAKKYKTKSLKEFIRSISQKPVKDQVVLLEENFRDWKGPLDQVDDVAIAVLIV